MNVVFADSYYFFALLNPKDRGHQLALDWTALFSGRLVTTSWIITELGDGMASVALRPGFLEALETLRSDSNFTIVPFDESLFDAGIDLYRRRLDKEWSLTDCVSFVVMHRERIVEALTADHHFEQAGFVALLK